ncbi:uncharacterized protein EAF02_000642 [Botrytis sinoallii]|uniref:uncharacterized protein n=1 Tax=Botrytis sinoallii TaxID=1463999 RepID=UPI0018FF14E7|nr:uncharacterized protein EAF02_000642 [Botrytis sinoallii]KAF7893104.1 hypothetical protein EAF02_000642 [Botrytis sinoallii]
MLDSGLLGIWELRYNLRARCIVTCGINTVDLVNIESFLNSKFSGGGFDARYEDVLLVRDAIFTQRCIMEPPPKHVIFSVPTQSYQYPRQIEEHTESINYVPKNHFPQPLFDRCTLNTTVPSVWLINEYIAGYSYNLRCFRRAISGALRLL